VPKWDSAARHTGHRGHPAAAVRVPAGTAAQPGCVAILLRPTGSWETATVV